MPDEAVRPSANGALTIVSLLSILFFSLHHADDVVRGMAPGGFANIVPVLFLAVWLYGTLALRGTRVGYAIVLVWSLLSLGIPLVHMRGEGLAGNGLASTGGAVFFVWTLIALGVTALVSVTLSARGLWNLRRGRVLST